MFAKILPLAALAALVAVGCAREPEPEVIEASSLSERELGISHWSLLDRDTSSRVIGLAGDRAVVDVSMSVSDLGLVVRSNLPGGGVEHVPARVGVSNTLSQFDVAALDLLQRDLAAAAGVPIAAGAGECNAAWFDAARDCTPFPDIIDAARAGAGKLLTEAMKQVLKRIASFKAVWDCVRALRRANTACLCSALECLNECYANNQIGQCVTLPGGYEECRCEGASGGGAGGGGPGAGGNDPCAISIGELCPAECQQCSRSMF